MTEDARSFGVGRLQVRVFGDAAGLGLASARHTAQIITRCVAERGSARVIFATGNSQFEFVRALAGVPGVPWDAVTIFHLDEWAGMADTHPASFRRWIAERLAGPLSPGQVHYIAGDAPDLQAECQRYESLLRAAPIDLACVGIGENGHIAFNEPHQADLDDPAWLRAVDITEQSRRQQVGEGHFPDVSQTPRRALTLTVPALLAARNIQAVVPERRKAEAVQATLTMPVSAACPATVLRDHPGAVLFLDSESAALLDPPARQPVNSGN